VGIGAGSVDERLDEAVVMAAQGRSGEALAHGIEALSQQNGDSSEMATLALIAASENLVDSQDTAQAATAASTRVTALFTYIAANIGVGVGTDGSEFGLGVAELARDIGMGDDLSLKEREAVRTPMHWSEDKQAGFSLHPKTVNPVISHGPFSCCEVNVAAQQRDPNSLFNWTAKMIRLRKECPEIGWGEWKILKTGSPSVLAMRYDWLGSSLVILHNLSDQPQEVRIHPGVEDSEVLVNLIENNESRASGNGIHRLALESYGYRWFRAGSLNYVLKRRKV
ncbi:MAG: hypothetical protein ACAI37_22790, partial [Chthoniobacter sp.]